MKGTHAHAYVTSFSGLECLTHHHLRRIDENGVESSEAPVDLLNLCLQWRPKVVEALGKY